MMRSAPVSRGLDRPPALDQSDFANEFATEACPASSPSAQLASADIVPARCRAAPGHRRHPPRAANRRNSEEG
jgi:hypothetical protein